MKEENENVDMVDIHNTSNHNSDSEGEVDQYVIEYYNRKDENDLNYDQSLIDKGYRKFLVADYVEYCKNTNVSKCLIRNCEESMSGRRMGNIKRHYHKVHNLVIGHDNKSPEKVTDAMNEQDCITVDLKQYFDYDRLMDKSRCTVPGCNTALVGINPHNIVRHYRMVHNFRIEPNKTNECNEPVYSPPKFEGQLAEAPSVPVNDLVAFDVETSTYLCLFVTCNQVLEKELSSIERHYNEIHKVAIARDSDKIPNRVYRKRMYRYIYQPFENDQQYVENKLQQYMNQTITTSSIKNEQLSDDELLEPQCSKELTEPQQNLKLPLGKKRGFGKFDLAKYVYYEKDKKMSKCLIKHCERSISGSLVGNIKRHYLTNHNLVILHGTRTPFEEIEEMLDITEEQISDLIITDKEAPHECLFFNCNHILEENLSAIKRHYLEIHKVLIVRYCDYMVQKKLRYRDMLQSYENEFPDDESGSMGNEFLSDDDKERNEPHTELQASLEKIKCGKLIVDNYVDYQKDKNISKCLIKGCKSSMSGCFVGNIKRHYLTNHNFVILHGTRTPFEEMSDITKEQINDLIIIDKVAPNKCLFVNCNHILEQNLSAIKRHYLEIHKIIIVKYSDYMVQKKLRYRDMLQSYENEFPDYESGSVGNKFLSDDDKRLYDPHTELQESVGKIKYGQMIIDNYVYYQKDKNISICLIKQCKRTMSGCFVGNIKRHYLTMHKFAILHGTRMPYEEMVEMSQTDTIINDLVPYDIATSSYQCLFINCNQILAKHLPTIRKHYHDIHKIVIARDTEVSARKSIYDKKCRPPNENEFPEDEFYSVNEFLSDDEKPQCSKKLNEPQNRQLLNVGKKGRFMSANYVQYDKATNISKCLIKHCKRSMSGSVVGNIKRHYKRIHNFIIQHGIGRPFEELDDISNNQTVDDLVAYDLETCSYQCLFINCNQVLEKDLPTIKRHYCEIHSVSLAKVKIKHKYRVVYELHDSEFLEDDSSSVRNDDEQLHCSKGPNMNLSDYMDETESCFIKNEYISDEEKSHNSLNAYTYDTESHAVTNCCKELNMNLSDYIDETESCFIKNEFISDDEENLHKSLNVNTYDTVSHPIKHYSKESAEKTQDLTVNKQYLQNKPTSIDITLSKRKFFQLCLGLVIARDLPLNLFDDEKYFKPLLAPYEQVFDCVINASVMQSIMLKANNIIVDDLTKTFTNKIVCLELHVVKRENIYYTIVNVRFLEEQTICNKLIGFLPVNETTTILPLAECLSNFNIKEQQVYMKTIMTDLQEDEEIYKICNNLCKHNSDVKNHPIYELQTILRTFVQKYSEDINTWQVMSEYQDKPTKDMLTSLKKFAQYLEDWSKTDLKLQEAKYFFKALQMGWNFMEKLNREQYVAGDFYRDWLCCELGLKGEKIKHNNPYAAELYDDLSKCKNKILESNEFIAALYLDARFNFLGSRLLSDTQKTKAKLFLCDIWDKFNNYLQTANSKDDALPKNVRDNDNSNDDAFPNNAHDNQSSNEDEHALLTQHINDTLPVKSYVSIQHKLTSFIPKQRQPISIDILKNWHCNRQFNEAINELTKIVFTHSASQYILRDLQTNFSVPNMGTVKFDKFLMKYNQSIVEKNTARILEDFN